MATDNLTSESLFPEGVAVVVGGSGGVGRSICLALAQAGTSLVITYRTNQEKAHEVLDEVTQWGGEGWIESLDVENKEGTRIVFERIQDEYGPIHTVVYAAGPAIGQPYISQVTAQQWSSVMQSDVNGFFHVVSATLLALRQTQGSLVAISSAGLYRYPAGDMLSVVPKGAIEALVRGIAHEEGRYGVRANCVALGVIEAGMFFRLKQEVFSYDWLEAAKNNTPLKRFGTGQEVAKAVVFLASNNAGFITGQTLMLDGGYSI